MTEAVPAPFTGEELSNSIPFDPERTLRGEGADELVSYVLALLATHEQRARALRAADAEARQRTANAFLANLAVAALNRIDPTRFVAMPFNRNDYVNTDLSYSTAPLLRDVLASHSLTEGQRGFRRFDYVDESFGRRSRLRATGALHDLFAEFGIERRSIRTHREKLIKLSRASRTAGQEPPEVEASRSVLERVNARLAEAAISLPDDAWERIAASRARRSDETNGTENDWNYDGDTSAVALYRVFTRTWQRGGRLYGGWWMNVPKEERPHITIDDEPTAELDYWQLHPSLLFARKGVRLASDLYDLHPFSRELGKETFARLLNRTAAEGGVNLRHPREVALPPGTNFKGYLALLLGRLEPVREWLGVGEGLHLQREDSDLAIRVLERLEQQGVIALPVHDSFIVQRHHASTLHTAMVESYSERYGHEPQVRRQPSPLSTSPTGP